jgi:uncharacterized OsmC-like protein
VLRQVLDRTAAKLAAEPGRALVRYRTEGVGGTGVRAEITVGPHTMLVDEPPSVGGDGAAPNPLETALASLLACQVVTYRLWAAKLAIPLDDVRVEVDGEVDVRRFFGLDETPRAGFGEIRVRVHLDGPAEPERYRELAAAVDEHCPVLDLFRHPTPVRVTLGQDEPRD